MRRITSDEINQARSTCCEETGSPVPFNRCGVSFKPYKGVHAGERATIVEALRRSGGNKTQAARWLGISTRQLYYRLTKLKIEQ